MINQRFYAINNYVKDDKQDATVHIADSKGDANKIAELMNLIPGYNPQKVDVADVVGS